MPSGSNQKEDKMNFGKSFRSSLGGLSGEVYVLSYTFNGVGFQYVTNDGDIAWNFPLNVEDPNAEFSCSTAFMRLYPQ